MRYPAIHIRARNIDLTKQNTSPTNWNGTIASSRALLLIGTSSTICQLRRHLAQTKQELLNEFYKKGCQEKSFPLHRTPTRFLSRHPAHSLCACPSILSTVT